MSSPQPQKGIRMLHKNQIVLFLGAIVVEESGW